MEPEEEIVPSCPSELGTSEGIAELDAELLHFCPPEDDASCSISTANEGLKEDFILLRCEYVSPRDNELFFIEAKMLHAGAAPPEACSSWQETYGTGPCFGDGGLTCHLNSQTHYISTWTGIMDGDEEDDPRYLDSLVRAAESNLDFWEQAALACGE